MTDLGRTVKRVRRDLEQRAHRATHPGPGPSLLAGTIGFGLGLAAAAGRRAAVQAPTYLAGDWAEGLKAEHSAARRLFEELDETTDDNPKRAGLVLQLQHAIGKHQVQEEYVVYCAMRDAGEEQGADKLHAEHGDLKQGLWDLERMGKQHEPGFLARLAEVRAVFEEHVADEETRLFPQLQARLDEVANRDLTNRMNREGYKVA